MRLQTKYIQMVTMNIVYKLQHGKGSSKVHEESVDQEKTTTGAVLVTSHLMS